MRKDKALFFDAVAFRIALGHRIAGLRVGFLRCGLDDVLGPANQ